MREEQGEGRGFDGGRRTVKAGGIDEGVRCK